MTAADLKAQYEKDGYTIVRNVIDQQLVEDARAHIEWLIEKNPELPPEGLDTFLVGDDPSWCQPTALPVFGGLAM